MTPKQFRIRAPKGVKVSNIVMVGFQFSTFKCKLLNGEKLFTVYYN